MGSRKSLGWEGLSRLELRGVRGDRKAQKDANVVSYTINARGCSQAHHWSMLSGLSFQVQWHEWALQAALGTEGSGPQRYLADCSAQFLPKLYWRSGSPMALSKATDQMAVLGAVGTDTAPRNQTLWRVDYLSSIPLLSTALGLPGWKECISHGHFLQGGIFWGAGHSGGDLRRTKWRLSCCVSLSICC